MTETIRIQKLNEVYAKILCEAGIAYELNEYFTFNVPGARFSPAYKNKVWDGKIRLFHLMRQTLYLGLTEQVVKFATQRGYLVEYEQPSDFKAVKWDPSEANQFIDQLHLPLTPRDYQKECLVHCAQTRRALILSPTASGKSLIIYMLASLFADQRVLIVVPTIGLVHQIASDFTNDYNCPATFIHKIFSGQEKITDAPFVITTWQSVYKQTREWFKQFNTIIGDEAHQFKSKSLVEMMEKTTECQNKFGFTGTLDGTQTNKLVLEGLFGPVKQTTTTAQLIQNNTLASLNIKAIVLQYGEQTRQMHGRNKPSYADEIAFLVQSRLRNKFIVNLTSSLKNNTLLLFNYIDHGKILHQQIQQQNPNKNVFLVYGQVEGEEREEIRKFAEQNKDVIIVASYKTFSTGINIQNLHNIIFASPSKSRIRVFQSIGRGLRKNQIKTSAVLYDIADDLSWKSYKNHTLRHFAERIQMYNQESFEYKTYNVQLEKTTVV